MGIRTMCHWAWPRYAEHHQSDDAVIRREAFGAGNGGKVRSDSDFALFALVSSAHPRFSPAMRRRPVQAPWARSSRWRSQEWLRAPSRRRVRACGGRRQVQVGTCLAATA